MKRTNLKWWQDTLVYEAYPSSFQDTDGDGYGDLQGLIRHLDYLESIGVGAVWLTPVYISPMRDNGYDVADYYKINPRYGTMDDMDQLIREAGAHGIRIVMDLVFNHTSEECPWFLESAADPAGEKGDWYIWADPVDGKAPNNWGGIFGGSAWTYHEGRGQYYLHTFADFQPDLNWENPKVRQALFDVANFWVNKGVGGFRLDAVTYIKKPSELPDGEIDPATGYAPIHSMTANTEGILDFLHEFKDAVQKGHDIFTVGEANGVPAGELVDWVGNDGVFDMIFEFSHVNLQYIDTEVWCKTRHWPLTELKKAFRNSQKSTADNGWYPVFLENHDQPRCINHFLAEGADPVLGAQALGMLTLTMRGTPFVYEGQELGMTNVAYPSIEDYDDLSTHNQYKIARDNGFSVEESLAFVYQFSRDNARTPMQWTDEPNAGFTTGKPWLAVNDNFRQVNAAAQESNPESVLNWYRRLAQIRKEHDALVLGDYRELFPEHEQIWAYERACEGETLLVLLNLSGEEAQYDAEAMCGERLISNYQDFKTGVLRPYEAVLFLKRGK